MRRLRLSASGWAPHPSQLLAAGVAGTILGVALAALSAPRWLSLLGVALATAGLAILVAAAGYRAMGDDAGRGLVLASLLFALAMPVASFLWFQRPAVEVTLGHLVPQPGAPLTLSGASGSGSRDHGPGQRPPSLEGTFTALEIADIGARSTDEEGARATTFHIGLPVAISDCARLEAEFGGGCAEPGPALRGFESLEIRTLRRTLPLTALIAPRGARTIELIETTAQAQQAVPTEWNLAHDGPSTDLELHCLDGAPLEVETPYAHARPTCALDGTTFWLAVEAGGRLPPTLFLSELSQFEADIAGGTAEAVIDDAELSIDGEAENLPSSPVKIAIDAEGDEDVDLDIDQSLVSGLNQVSFNSAGASNVTVGDRERVPNWFEQHPELAYFIIGILFATLIPALFDFVTSRLKR